MGLKLTGYNEVKESTGGVFEPLPPGGYVCRIVFTAASGFEQDTRITLSLDIAEGEFTGYFQKRFDRFKVWSHTANFRRKVFKDGKVAPQFKQLIEMIRRANPNARIDINDFNHKSLRQLICGFIFGEEEYKAADHTIKTAVRVQWAADVAKIRAGDFKIPPLRKLPAEETATNKTDFFDGADIPDSDLPF